MAKWAKELAAKTDALVLSSGLIGWKERVSSGKLSSDSGKAKINS